MNRVALFAAATVAMTLPAMALDQAGFERIAAGMFEPIMAEYKIPGLAVGVVMDGETYVFTTGLANAKAGTPVTTDTLFELGSVSKLFTVTLAAEAERDGVLALDEPVAAYIPDLDGTAFGDLTLAALATHSTGGMPLHAPEGVTSRAKLNAWLARWKPAAPPETHALLLQSQHRPPRRDRRRPAGHLLRCGDGGRTLPRARARRTPSSASPRRGWRTTPWAPTATAARPG